MATENVLVLVGQGKVLALVDGDNKDAGLRSEGDRCLC